MPPKSKKKTKVTLERMLLEPVPETPVPEPYFNIPSPEPYLFPLATTFLEGIKLLEHYLPEDINAKIKHKLSGRRIERMARFKDVYCMMGKGGNGLLVGDTLLQLKAITAFAYGPTHLVVAYEDLRLDIFSLQLRLIKTLKAFSPKKITFLKILSTPKNYESIILLANCGHSVTIHRIQKSMFSTLSCKLAREIIKSLEFPVTQMTEIPTIFKYYLRRDPAYKDCSLVCVSAVNTLYIIRINHFKLDMDNFWMIVYTKKSQEIGTNSVSWGQANIQAPSRDMKGDRLMLTYSFDSRIYFLAFKEVENYQDSNQNIKCEWIESYPFEIKDKKVAFCQYMKKNEILIVTEDNTVLVFHTKLFDIFEKPLRDEHIEVLSEQFASNLEARVVQTIGNAHHLQQITHNKPLADEDSLTGATSEELEMLAQRPLVTYADTFLYEYPSNEIYFLSERSFQVYVYCDWKLIADLLKVEQRYECAMNFLIAMHKRANKFDLGLEGSEKQLSQYIKMLALDFISKKLSKIKDMPEIINNLQNNDEFFKMVIIPIEFLTQTEEFTFLFEVIKEKIICSLAFEQTKACLKHCEDIFYSALSKFIEHGRIKFIPENQLQEVLDYFLAHEQLQMIDRLAIYFDLSQIDRNIIIQCLLTNSLVVSLAHICTQGNESEFVTPFVKFWGVSENYKRLNQPDYASTYAFRALWYVKLCLQRNWVLKEYSFDKYAKMITILSQHFLTERILLGLLQTRPTDCLETLSYYFTIENSQIINEVQLKLGNQTDNWIVPRESNEQLEILVSSIGRFITKAFPDKRKATERLNLFLSNIIIYKTIRFTEEKYFEILLELIKNFGCIQEIKYGLEDKMLREYEEIYAEYPSADLVEILAARYINKILTLVYYQCPQFIEKRLFTLYEQSRQYNLIDLQAEISFLQGKYSNCIELYIRSKKAAKILLFEFLENSFKRLVLEKKKEAKTELANCIKREIKYMVAQNPQKIKNLIQVYIPEIQEELIEALMDDETLQLEYLEGIISDEDRKQMKMKLSERSILRFVELMAKQKPDSLIDAFKKNPNFSVEDSLKICEQYQVYDCMEYLYERMGDVRAVKIAALRIDKILQTRNDYDEESFAPYIKIKEILDNAIEMCRKKDSEQIWESLLDSSIELYHKYLKSPLPEDEIEIFFYINGEIMENLASNCSIEHTINLLQNKYQNLNMGGKMTKAFINILSNLSHSINILYIASQLLQINLQKYLEDTYVNKIKCFHTFNECSTCRFNICRREKSLHFQCGHCYHTECVVYQEPLTCVACLMNNTDQFTYHLNTLNPRFPKIKKINQIFDRFHQKRFEMSEVFRIQEMEQLERREGGLSEAQTEKKRARMEKFDLMNSSNDRENQKILRVLS